MKRYSQITVSEFLQDKLIYRNFRPMDTRLPALDELRARLKLSSQGVPRKTSEEYALLLSHLLGHARSLDAPGVILNRLIYIGDTRLNDVTAFNNLCMAADWSGAAFICDENMQEPPHFEVIRQEETRILYFANRWEMIHEFNHYLGTRGFEIDERTAVLLDLDKTVLGARGRNDAVIDQAQVSAAFAVVKELVGGVFDLSAFEHIYTRFNQPAFHPLTAGSPDYPAYLCLMTFAGMTAPDTVETAIRSGQLFRFDQFLREMDERADEMSPAVREVHRDFAARIREGSPAPFKAFRVREYQETVSRMGQMGGMKIPLGALLTLEIVITQEIRERASDWNFRDALLFGISDRPDEAAVPPESLARQGYQPLHRTPTDAVGES